MCNLKKRWQEGLSQPLLPAVRNSNKGDLWMYKWYNANYNINTWKRIKSNVSKTLHPICTLVNLYNLQLSDRIKNSLTHIGLWLQCSFSKTLWSNPSPCLFALKAGTDGSAQLPSSSFKASQVLLFSQGFMPDQRSPPPAFCSSHFGFPVALFRAGNWH